MWEWQDEALRLCDQQRRLALQQYLLPGRTAASGRGSRARLHVSSMVAWVLHVARGVACSRLLLQQHGLEELAWQPFLQPANVACAGRAEQAADSMLSYCRLK